MVAQLLYASPAWWGFLKTDEKSRLQAVVYKAQRYGYLPTPFNTLDELRQGLDETLFHSSRYNPHHVLHRLLPRPKDTGQSSSEGTQPNTSFRCWLNRQAKFYHENVIHRYVLMIIFYLSNAIVYVFCTYYVFSSFLLCCNASAFVICAIKNYLLT